jgi:hypothetical protein
MSLLVSCLTHRYTFFVVSNLLAIGADANPDIVVGKKTVLMLFLLLNSVYHMLAVRICVSSP